jgi:multidrug resistance efflux pump
VIEVNVAEGDEVEAGQLLVELDKSDLLVRQAELETALATAEANLELASAPPLPEEIDQAEAQLAQAEAGLEGVGQTWQRLAEVVSNPRELEAKISQAQARVTQAEENLEMARVNLKRAEIGAEAAGRDQTTRMGGNEGIVGAEAAQYQVQSAQVGVQMAEVALAGTQRQVEHLLELRQRPLQLIAEANAAEAAYHRAEAAVLAARTNLAAVEAGPTAEEIAVAQAKVDAARTALAGVEVQLDKMTLTAPRAGLISRRLIEPGELARPGAVLLQLSDIDTVDLVVYIAETRMGEVRLGQKALVYVDAYEGEVFEGVVTFIAHEAEFTPQNVQTREERKNLVFAVKISLDNPEHLLRPGMPADAVIVPGEFVELNSEAPALDIRPNIVIEPQPVPTPEIAAAPMKGSASKPVVEAGPTVQAEVISAGLNVRTGPGTDHPVMATLLKGDTVRIVETDPETGWLKIELPAGTAGQENQTGWISGHPAYVTIR